MATIRTDKITVKFTDHTRPVYPIKFFANIDVYD